MAENETTTPTQPDYDALYPEHAKLAEVSDKSQAIGAFIDWLQEEQGFSFGKYGMGEDEDMDTLTPTYLNIQDELAAFFGIDQKVIEQEKRAMLDSIRAANA